MDVISTSLYLLIINYYYNGKQIKRILTSSFIDIQLLIVHFKLSKFYFINK